MENERSNVLSICFVLNHTLPYWSEVLFGVEHGFLDAGDAIRFAESVLGEGDDVTLDVARLAIRRPGESGLILEILKQLSSLDVQRAESMRVWCFLSLLWVYENQAEVEDPLEEVECIYADFDYPPRVASFVRYMPSEQPGDLHAKWKAYLAEEAEYFRARSASSSIEPEST